MSNLDTRDHRTLRPLSPCYLSGQVMGESELGTVDDS